MMPESLSHRSSLVLVPRRISRLVLLVGYASCSPPDVHERRPGKKDGGPWTNCIGPVPCARLNTTKAALAGLSSGEVPGKSSPPNKICSMIRGPFLREQADGPYECDVVLVWLPRLCHRENI